MSVNHIYKKPYIVTIACTKGGSAKSTNAANMGAFCADHGLRTLLIDTDSGTPTGIADLDNVTTVWTTRRTYHCCSPPSNGENSLRTTHSAKYFG